MEKRRRECKSSSYETRLTVNPRKGQAGVGDRIPGLSRRSFIRATRNVGLLSGLSALLAACRTTAGPSRYRPNSRPLFPNASTTGPPAGGYALASLTPIDLYPPGGIRIGDSNWPPWVHLQENGTLLIEGVDFYYSQPPAGSIALYNDTAHPVEYRGCRFTAYNQTILLFTGKVPHTLVQYCHFRNASGSRLHCGVGSGASNTEVHHCNFEGWSNPLMCSRDPSYGYTGDHWYIHENYVHDPIYFEGDHTDCLNIWGGLASDGKTPTANHQLDFRIIHNTFFNSQVQTSCIENPGGVDGLLVQGNLFAGGGYTIYCGTEHAPSYNSRYTGNYFSTRYHPTCGSVGYATYAPVWGEGGNEWSGNYWFDGPRAGTLIAPPLNGLELPRTPATTCWRKQPERLRKGYLSPHDKYATGVDLAVVSGDWPWLQTGGVVSELWHCPAGSARLRRVASPGRRPGPGGGARRDHAGGRLRHRAVGR